VSTGSKRGAQAGESAAQHVLRHLDDPLALRDNPLVAPLFEGAGAALRPATVLDTVAELVRSCAEQLRAETNGAREHAVRRERQYQILVRCDLESEPHETVAADLALSRRQFYRERKEAAQYLAQFLQQAVSERVARSQEVRLDRFALEVARAKALRLAGEPGASERILRDLVVADDEDVARRVEPWCHLVDLLVNDNRSGEAEHEITRLRAALAGARGLDRAAARDAHVRVEMQVAAHLWFQGRLPAALAVDEREEGGLLEMARSANPAAREFFMRTRIRQALCGLMSGSLTRARGNLEEVRATLDADDLPLAPRIEFLIVYGNLKDHAMGDSGEAMNMVFEALDLARRHGLVELVIDAMSGLSSAAQIRGDHQAGRRYVYDILPTAEHAALPAQRGMLLNVAAISEAALGQHKTAVALAHRARSILAGDSLERIYSSLAEAQARVTIGQFAEGGSAAADAQAAAAAIGSDRLSGTALRLLAESAEGLGNLAGARERIVGAIEALEHEGPPFALLQAYRAAARITGEPRYARTAAELAAAIAR
jgi:hypothetical protein